ncbi:MAG: hypothetical protein JWM27_1631 [Gemmatimonadetes bacterium]|nr:hypothetical protein [Gemmatimonadota bacterium]
MSRKLIIPLMAAALLLGACERSPSAPAVDAGAPGGTVDASNPAGTQAGVPITLDGLAALAIAKLALTKPDAARTAQAQVDALKASLQAAEQSGDAVGAQKLRDQLRGLETSLVIGNLGLAVVDQLLPAVDAALKELRAKLDSLQAGGKDVKLPRAMADSAAVLLAKAKAQPATERGGALNLATQAGALIEAARRAAGLTAGTPGAPTPTPTPTPSGLWSTIETPRAWDYVPTPVSQSACAGQGAAYDVGPGQPLATPAQVPWLALRPCDNVRIHWQQNPYRDVVLLSNRGAANRYIRITGVPGPGGELPVLDGGGAKAAAGIPWLNPVLEGLGMIVVSPPKAYTYGFKPGYIEISNLEIRGARATGTYTNGAGQTVPWQRFASGIYIERAENVAIRNCHIHDNGNGIFQNSKFDEAAQSRYLLIEGSHVHDNGNAGSASEHNAYTEGVGTVYQGNWFGPTADGSYGDNIKERSAGITLRYNRIEGGVHLVALRDPQSNSQFERTQRDAWGSLLVNAAYVYGNVLVMRERPTFTTGWPETMVAFGDGTASYANIRGGTLYFHHNTVVSQSDQGVYQHRAAILFEVINDTGGPVVQARNNVFFAASATAGRTPTPFAVFYHYGNADFRSNWISAGWMGIDPNTHALGNVLRVDPAWNGSGISGTLGNAQNAPGFSSAAADDYHPAAGSQLIGAGTALGAEPVKTANAALREYVHPQSTQPRKPAAAPALGAFEF